MNKYYRLGYITLKLKKAYYNLGYVARLWKTGKEGESTTTLPKLK
jgi:hypothetical protein